MATEVTLPALGESVTEGTVTRWLKQVGDTVSVDEALLEVSTDKVDTEIPSPVAGTLLEIKAAEDETVEIGAILALIGDEGESTGGGDSSGEESSGGSTDESAAAEDEGDAQAETAAEEGETEQPAAEPEPEQEQPAAEEKPSGGESSGGGKTTSVTLPALGESVTEGTVTRWLKQVGDDVAVDEALLEVSTDKVDTEIPSPVAGTLLEIKAEEDETVEVGAELAVIGGGGGGEAAAPAAEEQPAERERARQEPAEGGAGAEAEEAAGAEPEAGGEAAEAEPEPEAKPAAKGRTRQDRAAPRAGGDGKAAAGVSPLVRRLAREHDVDLRQVQGSGSGGRVRREDVEAYVQQRGQAPAAKAPSGGKAREPGGKAAATTSAPPRVAVPLAKGLREELVPATRLRRVIAERMVSSLQTSAQLTSAVEIDMTRVMRLRERAKDEFKAREGVSLSPMPFAVLALIAAIREYPTVNSAIDEDGNLHVYQDVHLGVAVDTPKGLFVPVVKQAESLNLAGLAKAIADVAKRTRDGKIGPDELSGSTISITNTGSRGAVWDTPIINQPNAAIFATPAIVKRPVVVDDPDLGEVVAVRHMMYGILTYDHRIIDGADAARFLVKVKEVLEAADFEGDLGLERE
ncbi:MAG: 2-oxoglutarate dehydrogenase, E2 component, dihydrolipoamide succinyltransferase [Actinomycetes bacterium]